MKIAITLYLIGCVGYTAWFCTTFQRKCSDAHLPFPLRDQIAFGIACAILALTWPYIVLETVFCSIFGNDE